MSRAKGHNQREHATKSQLPQSAWLSPDGNGIRYKWQDAKVARATALAKRKDAVIGIEMAFQIGTQHDWRHPPTKEHPFGKPRKPRPADLKALERGIRNFLVKEFGSDNVVSLVLHMDESTPHYQAVVTAERDGKLNAKHWTGGATKLAGLWKRSHAAISKYVPCTYTPGSGRGGELHDPGKRAGSTPPEGVLDKLTALPSLRAENERLRERVAELEQQLFSRQKARYVAAQLEELTRERDAARKEAADMEDLAKQLGHAGKTARDRVRALEAQLGDKERQIEAQLAEKDQQIEQAQQATEKAVALGKALIVELRKVAPERLTAVAERFGVIKPAEPTPEPTPAPPKRSPGMSGP